MKNRQNGFIVPLLITIIALLAIGGGFYFYTKGITKKTEEVSCSATASPTCHLYRCNTGYISYIRIPPPGSIPFECSDGSTLETVKEVSLPNNLKFDPVN